MTTSRNRVKELLDAAHASVHAGNAIIDDAYERFKLTQAELEHRAETMSKLAKLTNKKTYSDEQQKYDEARRLHEQQTPKARCSCCGAITTIGCECGAPYLTPGIQKYRSAFLRASQFVAAHPEMSNRAIAKRFGLGLETVRRARTTDPDGSVESRIGLDGKRRKLPKKRKARTPRPSPTDDLVQEECADCETPEQFWQTSLSNAAGDAVAMRAYWTRQFGEWQSFPAPSWLITLAQQAAQEWAELTVDLIKRRKS